MSKLTISKTIITPSVQTPSYRHEGKPATCVGCPLYDRPIVYSEKPKTAKESYLWIVGEAPGYTEVSQQRPFVGKAGELLRTTLTQIGCNEPIVITNACLCHPDQNKTPSILAIKKCKPHFDKLFKKYPPKFIIALGSIACKALGIKTTKIDSMRGKVFKTVYGPCLVTYHPSRILRSKYRLQSLFTLDLKKALHASRIAEKNARINVSSTNNSNQNFSSDEIKALNQLVIEEKPEDQITILTEEKDIINLLKSIPSGILKAIDIETSFPDEAGNWPEWGLNPYHPLNSIYSFAIAFEDKAFSFPVDPKGNNRIPLEGNPESIKRALKKFLETTQNLIAHNCKFEYQMLYHHLQVKPNFSHDTQLLAYLIKETLQGFYNLNSLIEVYLPEHQGFKEVRKNDLLLYNGMDTLYTLRLFHALNRELMELPQRDHILKAEEFLIKSVVPLIAKVEHRGVCVDWKKLIEYKKAVEEVKQKIELELKNLTGTDNPRTLQFRRALEQLLEQNSIPIPRTDTGLIDMSKEALAQIAKAAYVDDVKKVVYYKLSHTKLDKSLTAYLDKYPTFLNKYTNRIHPTYRIEGTVTGRLSSEKPNFQQIPREGLQICPSCQIVSEKNCPICESKPVELINISKLIIPPKGYDLISVDYSQMEVRILAHVTKDETLCEVISNGIDLHSYTASKIYKIPYEKIVKEKDTDPEIKKMRQFAKSATFGIIYGITAKGLAINTGTSVAEAQNMIEKFYETYPKVKRWIDSIHAFVQRHKYVISPMGRVRRFDTPQIMPEMLREAQNFPIQSYASDLTLAAAAKIAEEIEKYDAHVVGLIHDSIKIESPKAYTGTIADIVKDIMINWIVEKYKLIVPLEIDLTIYEGRDSTYEDNFITNIEEFSTVIKSQKDKSTGKNKNGKSTKTQNLKLI